MVEMIMPKMGESVAEATILKWLKKEGDRVEADESVLEIATDKVDSEIPSPVSGVLSKRLFEEGAVVKVGEVIAQINEGKESSVAATAPAAQSNGKAEKPAAIPTPVIATPVSTPASVSASSVPRTSSEGKFYSPLVRNIAKQEGVTVEELERIKGSGMDERVTKNDLLNYISTRTRTTASPTPPKEGLSSAFTSSPKSTFGVIPTFGGGGATEIIEMDRMGKLIADHMVMSKHTSPHVTSFVEVDVTNMVKWREKVKDEFQKREREKITFTPLFIEAVCHAIKDFPMVNVSVDGTKIIVKKYINIGMATALPSGHLIVPVIKNADNLNLIGLTRAVNDLASRARNNKLKPDEIQDGTFTITNVGTFGNLMGTPIINQPQVAIIATGAIRKKPVVVETPDGDTIGIRQMMFLSLGYDHRVVNGALGGSFLRRVADYLEAFDSKRPI